MIASAEPLDVAALPIDAAGLCAAAALLGARALPCDAHRDLDEDARTATVVFDNGWRVLLVSMTDLVAMSVCAPMAPDDDGRAPIGHAVYHQRGADA